MLKAYANRDGYLATVPVRNANDLSQDVLWVDLVNPTPLEMQYLSSAYRQPLDDLEELVDTRASARVYRNQDGMHLSSYFLHEDEGGFRNVTVGFTLNAGRLFTLGGEELREFREFRYRARHEADQARDAWIILCGLFESRAARLADTLDQLHAELETLSRSIFSSEQSNMTRVLTGLARIEDTNGKVRLGVLDNQRALSNLIRSVDLSDISRAGHVRQALSDIESLVTHSTYLFDKTEFLAGSAMGTIDIQQNKIIKLFSVAAVLLMPPTLVASLYGMNFKHMPELDWEWGYPLSVLVMLIAAFVPYMVFKKKGWL